VKYGKSICTILSPKDVVPSNKIVPSKKTTGPLFLVNRCDKVVAKVDVLWGKGETFVFEVEGRGCSENVNYTPRFYSRIL
jgi:hypothetical protein